MQALTFRSLSRFSAIDWEDHLREHPAYVRCAVAASQVYVLMYDAPFGETRQHDEKTKKPKKKAKKPTKTTEVAQENGVAPPVVDEDPEGLKLVSISDPLEQASRLLRPLEAHIQPRREVLLVSFDVALRRGRYLQAIRALKRGREMHSEDPEFHLRTVEFLHARHNPTRTVDDSTMSIVTEEEQKMGLSDVTAQVVNQIYVQKHPHDVKAVWAGYRADMVLGVVARGSDEIVTSIQDPDVRLDLMTANNICKYLKQTNSPRLQEFLIFSSRQFPLSTLLRPTGVSNGFLDAHKKPDLAASEIIY